MENITREVAGLGALNMDYLYRVERILVDGEAVIAEPQSFPGGSAANTIYGLARVGIQTGFIGITGDDADGARLIEDLRGAGVDTGRIKQARGARSGCTLCLSDAAGRRSIYVVPGANNLLDLDELDVTYIRQAKWLHVSSFAGEKQLAMLLRLMNELREEPSLSLSPGAIYARRGLAALGPLLKRTRVLFINRGELKELTGEDDIAKGAENCIRLGCRTVAVTLGGGVQIGNRLAAAYIYDIRQEYIIAPPEAANEAEMETTGAGDAFAAGFIYGLLNCKRIEVCGKLGVTVARAKLSRPGGRAGLPGEDGLARLYAEQYKRIL